jgi:hypothetical protein
MGDDKQVRDLSKVAKEIFLKDAEHIDAEKPQLYNLENEFARTRANRSLRVVFLVLGFVVLAVGATIFLTLYIDRQNRRIKVDIADFEDVTLKDLLSSARKNEDELNAATQALADAQAELAVKNQVVANDIAGKIALVDAQGLSQQDHDAAVQKLRDQQKAQLAGLAAAYAPIFKKRQADIDAAQKKIDAYDTRQMEAAKKQAEVLNNQERLHDLELNQIKAEHEARLKDLADSSAQQIAALKANQASVINALNEKYKKDIAALILKYNPVFDTPTLKALIALPMEAGIASTLTGLSARLTAGKYADPRIFTAIQDSLAKRSALFDRISQIPYQNSVPAALARLDYFDRLIMKTHESLADGLLSIIKDDEGRIADREAQIAADQARIAGLQAVIDRDNTAFVYYTRDIRENGFVLDARDAEKLAVVVAPSYPVTDGDEGLVFRADNEYIGSIQFSVTLAGISAKVIEVVPSKQIEPFDKFLIKKM